MQEILVETAPVLMGALVGVVFFWSEVSPLMHWGLTILGSIGLGVIQAWLAEEISADLWSSAVAISIDSASSAAGWLGAYVVLDRRYSRPRLIARRP
jgi:hypothetical protein